MHLKRCRFLLFLIAGLVLVASMGCQPAPAQPTLIPTVAMNQPASPSPTPETASQPQADPSSYPVPAQETGATPTAPGYPVDGMPASTSTPEGYPAPGGAPAAENRAKVTGTIIEKAADVNYPVLTRLHVSVQAVADVDGMPNQAKGLVNQEADLFIEAGRLPNLNPNDRFEAVVSYEGDERGGRFTVLEIKKLE